MAIPVLWVAILLERFLRHDEILGAEAHLILGERKVTIALHIFIRGLFIRACLPILPFLLLRGWLNGVFIFLASSGVLFSPVMVLLFLLRRGLERRR